MDRKDVTALAQKVISGRGRCYGRPLAPIGDMMLSRAMAISSKAEHIWDDDVDHEILVWIVSHVHQDNRRLQ